MGDTTTINKPYVYIIGWPDQHRYYIGGRWSKQCYVGDIWQSYFTSSKVVKRFAKKYGDPTFIEILSVHDTISEAIEAEQKLLADAVDCDHFLNLGNGGGYRSIDKERCRIKSVRQFYSDPDNRNRHSERMRQSWAAQEERREKLAERMKGPRWDQNAPKLTYLGVTKTVYEWAEEVEPSAHQLLVRKNQGWSDEDCLLRPVRRRRTKNHG
jgi:hypothetical protein